MKNRTQKNYTYPLLLLLVPYISGVLFFYVYKNLAVIYLLIPAIAGFFFTYLRYKKTESYTRTLFIHLFIYSSAFLFGYLNIYLSTPEVAKPHDSDIYHACIIDSPVHKEKGTQVQVRILSGKTDNHTLVNQHAQLFLAKTNENSYLKPGSIIIFNTYLQTTDKPSPPGIFSYNEYLQKKNISFTAFVDSSSWELQQQVEYKSAQTISKNIRSHIHIYLSQIFTEQSSIALIEALLLGEKKLLSDEQKENFRQNGISHLLAVSGFHVGLIYTFIFALLMFIPRSSRIYNIRLLLPLPILFFYCFLVGFTPSVLRAVLMITVYTIAALFEKDRFSLNTLFFAALALLVYNPLFITDLGFQLSFLAVFAILIAQSFNQKLLINKPKWIRIFLSYLIICISAQMITAPLVSYHFGIFPTYFLVANILSLPFIYVLFGGSVIIILLRACTVSCIWLSNAIQKTIYWFELMLTQLRGLPASTIKISLNLEELLSIYIIFLCCLFVAINHKKIAYTTILIWICILGIIHLSEPAGTLYITSSRNEMSVLVQKNKTLTCFHTDTIVLSDDHDRLLKRDLKVSDINHYPIKNMSTIAGRTILKLNTDTLRKLKASNPVSIDYLILSQGCKDSLTHIISQFESKHIILDTGLSIFWRKQWKEEAKELQIELSDLNDIGFFKAYL